MRIQAWHLTPPIRGQGSPAIGRKKMSSCFFRNITQYRVPRRWKLCLEKYELFNFIHPTQTDTTQPSPIQPSPISTINYTCTWSIFYIYREVMQWFDSFGLIQPMNKDIFVIHRCQWKRDVAKFCFQTTFIQKRNLLKILSYRHYGKTGNNQIRLDAYTSSDIFKLLLLAVNMYSYSDW